LRARAFACAAPAGASVRVRSVPCAARTQYSLRVRRRQQADVAAVTPVPRGRRRAFAQRRRQPCVAAVRGDTRGKRRVR